jgi:hypothetical protein
LLIKPSFATAPARLDVTTEPSGATITLDGRNLGESPKLVEGLSPGKDLQLVLAKPGYQPVTKKVTLVAGKTFTIKETLKEATKFGSLQVNIRGGWANIYFGGKNLGINATGSTGLNTFKIPVGRQQIRLVNPSSGKSKTITVNIEEGKLTTVGETLDK